MNKQKGKKNLKDDSEIDSTLGSKRINKFFANTKRGEQISGHRYDVSSRKKNTRERAREGENKSFPVQFWYFSRVIFVQNNIAMS